jgi:hypothetical protein
MFSGKQIVLAHVHECYKPQEQLRSHAVIFQQQQVPTVNAKVTSLSYNTHYRPHNLSLRVYEIASVLGLKPLQVVANPLWQAVKASVCHASPICTGL